jgi:hypothetical protein
VTTLPPSHHPSRHRRALRRIGIASALTLGTLGVAQVVIAAPPDGVDFTYPTQVTRGVPAPFVATATDPDGDPITYSWDFGDSQGAQGQSVSHDYAGEPAGAKTVTLTADDGNSVPAPQVSHTLTVVNAPPTAAIVHAVAPEGSNGCPGSGQNPQVPLVGQQVGFSATSLSDPDNSVDANPGDEIKSLAWDLDNDGVFGAADAESTSSGATRSFADAGSHTVALQVTDSDDAATTATDTFRVNTPPAPDFFASNPTPVTHENVQFAANANDPDGAADPASYAWDVDNDGFDDSTSQFPTFSFATSGNKTIRLCVRDSGGVSRMVSHVLPIQTTVPTVTWDSTPKNPLPGQPVTFTASATPTSGDVITQVEWDFDWNGTTFTPDAQGVSASHAFPSAGSKNVAVKVTQAEPSGDNPSYKIVPGSVTVNAPPVAGFTESPRTAYVGDPVTLASTSNDPDGPLVRQDWDLDDDGQFDDANAQVVSAKFNRAKTYPIKLRVTDSKGATATYTDQVVVRSRPLRNFTGVSVNVGSVSFKRYTKFVRIVVSAVRGAKIKVECRGKGCPKAVVHNSRGRPIRFKRFERKLRVGTKLMVTISKPGYLTKQWVYTIRSRRPPVRRVVCRPPGSKRGTRCPTG